MTRRRRLRRWYRLGLLTWKLIPVVARAYRSAWHGPQGGARGYWRKATP